MAIDPKLVGMIKERKYDPWNKEGRTRSGFSTYLPMPKEPIPDLLSMTLSDEAVWLGIDCGFNPDPSAIVTVKHMRISTNYRKPGDINNELARSYTTSIYRVVKAEELAGVSYPNQRDHVQRLIDLERTYGNSVRIAIDATGVGVAVSQDWKMGLHGYDDFIPVSIVSGQPRKLKNKSVSDLLLGTMRAFEEARIGIPKSSEFAIRKLQNQLVTRGIETDFRGRLKAIDERSSSMSHYDLAIALSLVVGHNEHVDSTFWTTCGLA